MYFPTRRCASYVLYVLDCSRLRRDICENYFCSCELRCSRADWILLPCCFYLATNECVRHSRRTPAGLETRNRQDVLSEPQLVSEIVTWAVSRLSVFYSLVVSIQRAWVCAIRSVHLLGSTARIQRHIRADCFAVVKCAVVGLGVYYSAVWYFCSYDCLVVALSVFYIFILSWSADSLK